MCEKFHQLLAVGRWFPPGTPVSSTRKLISSSSFHRLDMTLAVAEALNPNKPNQTFLVQVKSVCVCVGGGANDTLSMHFEDVLIMNHYDFCGNVPSKRSLLINFHLHFHLSQPCQK